MPQDNPREPLGLLVVKDMVSFIFELQVEFNVRTGLPWKAGPQQPSPNLSKKKMLKIFLLSERHLGTETMNFRDPGGQVAESEPPPRQNSPKGSSCEPGAPGCHGADE